jgi:hypothetical protein
MKKVFCLALIVLLIFSLTSCADLISTETQKVDVLITYEDYSGAWLQPVWTGQVFTYIPHPAQYEITVKYNGIEYTLDNETYYNAYKDRIGDTITGTLEIKTYDDGTVKYDIIALEG